MSLVKKTFLCCLTHFDLVFKLVKSIPVEIVAALINFIDLVL